MSEICKFALYQSNKNKLYFYILAKNKYKIKFKNYIYIKRQYTSLNKYNKNIHDLYIKN